jgi:hypothetical protein
MIFQGKMPHPLSFEMLNAKVCPRCQEHKPPGAFYVGQSYCKPCAGARSKQWAKDNPERRKELHDAENERNRDKRNAHRRAREKANRSAANAKKRDYFKRNPDKRRAKARAYHERYPWRRRAAKWEYKAAKMQRLPAWADLKSIRAIYESCPPGHHVDHVIPLRGKNVSGLHVAGNLQYLPAEHNLAKGNSF